MKSWCRPFAVLLIILCIILALILVAGGVRLREQPTISGGADPWWSAPVEPEARRALQRYVRRTILPTLPDQTKSRFNRTLHSTINSPAGRRMRLKQLEIYLSQSSLAKTRAGSGRPGRGKHRATEIVKFGTAAGVTHWWPYLDIGGGDGSITRAIAQAIGAPPGEAFNAEPLTEPGDFPPELVWVQEEANGGLPLPDSKFELVTALMSLHHVTPQILPHLLEEIARVMRPGGILIVREHNLDGCKDSSLSPVAARQFIDWIHILYDLIEGTSIDNLEQSYYQSPDEWDAALAENFIPVFRRSGDPTTCSYYSVYRHRD